MAMKMTGVFSQDADAIARRLLTASGVTVRTAALAANAVTRAVYIMANGAEASSDTKGIAYTADQNEASECLNHIVTELI